MALDGSHAARQGNKTFAVEVVSGRETATVLAAALRDFLDAFDCAMDWVEREDPERTGDSSVAIFATTGDVRKQVWAYPTEAGKHAAGETRRLVDVFGFDPVAWKPSFGEVDAVRDRPPRREVRPLEREVRPTREHSTAFVAAVAEPPPEVEPPPPSPGERLDAWLKSGSRHRLRQDVLAVWDDRISRWCLILGVIFLWLTLTLLEPAFLAALLAAAACLWSRRGHRATPAADGVDDWF